MIGNAAKVSRLVVFVAVGGNTVWMRERAAFTTASVWNMSTFPVEEQIDFGRAAAGERPDMVETRNRVDSLLDRPVTATCIWSMGITPLSAPITIAGSPSKGTLRQGY